MLSYLALDGQHHLYSASTFKLTYSRPAAITGYAHQVVFNALCPGRSARVLWVSPFTETSHRLQVPKVLGTKGIRSRANPSSLAATGGISIDFFSSADLYA